MQKLLIFFAIIALANAEHRLHTLKLKKFDNSIKNLGNVRAERHFYMNRYNAQVSDDDSHECVEDLDGIAKGFYGEITIGTPPQTLTALFDTGTPVFFVQKKLNSNGLKEAGFNFSASSTIYHTNVDSYTQINFNNSVLDEDVIIFADRVNVAGMELFDTRFLVNEIAYTSLKYPVIFGLGYNVNTGSTPPPLDYMLQQGFIDQKVFSFYFDPNNYNSDGKIIFGGIDSTLYQGNIAYANIVSGTNWNINVDTVSVNGIVAAPQVQAVVDTSYSFIGAPIEAYVRINQQINGTAGDEGIYYVNCDNVYNLPDVVFQINGLVFNLKSTSYILKVKDHDKVKCMVSFLFMSTDNWVLGQAFVSAFYTIFDQTNDRIGFAYPVST